VSVCACWFFLALFSFFYFVLLALHLFCVPVPFSLASNRVSIFWPPSRSEVLVLGLGPSEQQVPLPSTYIYVYTHTHTDAKCLPASRSVSHLKTRKPREETSLDSNEISTPVGNSSTIGPLWMLYEAPLKYGEDRTSNSKRWVGLVLGDLIRSRGN